MESMVDRFIRYTKINTRSDENSNTIPSTKTQVEFGHLLVEDLKAIGLTNAFYNEANGYVIASLPGNVEGATPIGFISHMDTADYNAVGISPRVIKNYDGKDICLNEEKQLYSKVSDFPNLKKYEGLDLVVTDGTTLLGGDDKAGIVEIFEALIEIQQDKDFKHGPIYVGFGPDEEIGSGANHFDTSLFPVEFAYTVDGSKLGELEYETFNAANATVHLKGISVHTGDAKDTMINCAKLAMEFDAMLPAADVPEHTEGREGFFMCMSINTTVGEGTMEYLIRDHSREVFEARKNLFMRAARTLNERYGREVATIDMYDRYYNMYEIVKDHMECVEIAKKAMEEAGVAPLCQPIRGGTDGSKISFMGIPTPNLFTGVENLHGPNEFACIDHMKKSVEVIKNIVRVK